MLRVGLDAGKDYRAGEIDPALAGVKGTPGENLYRSDDGKALHTEGILSHSLGMTSGVTPSPAAVTPSPAAVIPSPDGTSVSPSLPLTWSDLGRTDILPEGHVLGEVGLLFQKIEDEVVEREVGILQATKAANEAAAKAAEAAEAAKKVEPQKEEVTFDDFGRMDIRTATVLAAERVPKTDKLLKLSIDTGIDQRTIVSGIAEFYTPEEMVGKQICILANLAPRIIRGIESRGMILMAKQGDGKMRIVSPEEKLTNGAVIG